MGDITEFLIKQLLPDIKNFVISKGRSVSVPVKQLKAKVFKSPYELLDALKRNGVNNNEWVTLECKPSSFGTMLKDHCLYPLIGKSSDMRLGPAIQSSMPFMGLFANAASHLKPVGLYPPIDDKLYQVNLYPSDINAFGFTGLIPGIDQMITSIPAICSAENLAHCNVSCNVTGIVRQVTPNLLNDIGASFELWEVLRQKGDIWFLDLFDEFSKVNPLGDVVVNEIWGGLFALGHVEINSGDIYHKEMIDALFETIRSNGVTPHVTQNQGGNKEYFIYGKGVRATLSSKAPVYSIHMDAELAISYSYYKSNFDKIVSDFVGLLPEVAKVSGAVISNPNDLDFTYSDSAKSFKVLSSLSADRIADPLAISIRNWHRKRSDNAVVEEGAEEKES